MAKRCKNCSHVFRPHEKILDYLYDLIGRDFPHVSDMKRETMVNDLCSYVCWRKYLGII